jgi:hypothetical protein
MLALRPSRKLSLRAWTFPAKRACSSFNSFDGLAAGQGRPVEDEQLRARVVGFFPALLREVESNVSLGDTGQNGVGRREFHRAPAFTRFMRALRVGTSKPYARRKQANSAISGRLSASRASQTLMISSVLLLTTI